jgi:plasmid replication initiation protein
MTKKIAQNIIENPDGSIARFSNYIARSKLMWKPRSVWDLRLFILVASKVKKDDAEFFTYKIPVSELTLNEKIKGSEFQRIDLATDELMKAFIKINYIENKKRVVEKVKLFDRVKYIEGGYIEIKFYKDMIPFFFYITEQFTLIQMEEYLKLTTKHSQLLFTFLKSWSGLSEKEVTLNELHELLQAPKSCINNFAEFNRSLLKPTIRAINKNTSLKISYFSNTQQGKKVENIRFIFHEQLDLPFNEQQNNKGTN